MILIVILHLLYSIEVRNILLNLMSCTDNVHFQHSAILMKALIEEGVNFRSQVSLLTF